VVVAVVVVPVPEANEIARASAVLPTTDAREVTFPIDGVDTAV
jgi:hypothetical protein